MSATNKGMIFLGSGNQIIKEAAHERLVEGKRDPGLFELAFADFDDVSYKFACEGGVITLQAHIPNYPQLVKAGVEEELTQEFGSLRTTPQSGYEVAVKVDCDSYKDDRDALVYKLSHLRAVVAGVPIKKAFTELAKKKSDAAPTTPLLQYDWRRTETVFVVPQKDRVVVIFSLDFLEETDSALAKVFLQEFIETQRTVNGAPVCSYSKAPPLELKSLNLGMKRPVPRKGGSGPGDVEDGIAGYLSFAFFPSHVQTEDKRTKAVHMLVGFRNYLHYHIKCSKTYLHMRMRKRVDSLLQVLNRARPEVETEKKTMGGKTFTRKS